MLINQVMNIFERLRVIGKTIDIMNPEDSSLTIGDKIKTATEMQIDLAKQLSNARSLQQNVEVCGKRITKQVSTVSGLASTATSYYETLKDETLPDLIKRLESLEQPPTPPTDENGYSTSRVFPVDYTLPGINFFVRAGKVVGSIEYDMTYGPRDGVLH